MKPPLNLTTAERERWAYANGQVAAAKNLGALCDAETASKLSAAALQKSLLDINTAVEATRKQCDAMDAAVGDIEGQLDAED
jgi:hypothetical protein